MRKGIKRKNNELPEMDEDYFAYKPQKFKLNSYASKVIRLYPNIFDPKFEERNTHWHDRPSRFIFPLYRVRKIKEIIERSILNIIF
jgi:hypothetical protein